MSLFLFYKHIVLAFSPLLFEAECSLKCAAIAVIPERFEPPLSAVRNFHRSDSYRPIIFKRNLVQRGFHGGNLLNINLCWFENRQTVFIVARVHETVYIELCNPDHSFSLPPIDTICRRWI